MPSISSATPTSAVCELATLLVEIDSSQAESDRLTRDNARQNYLDHAQDQVSALHDAASAALTGALTSAAFAAAGGALTIASATVKYDSEMNSAAAGSIDTNALSLKVDVCTYRMVASGQASQAAILEGAGKTLGGLAGPSNALAQGVAEGFKANAKQAEVLGEQAKWEASDAATAADKADQRSDKFLDLLQGIQRDQSSANNAIIGRI